MSKCAPGQFFDFAKQIQTKYKMVHPKIVREILEYFQNQLGIYMLEQAIEDAQESNDMDDLTSLLRMGFSMYKY